MDWKFNEGDYVRKTGGYPFPGLIEARFLLTQIDGTKAERYLVNQIVWTREHGTRPSGLGHIFSPEQLKLMERPEVTRLEPYTKPVASEA